MFKNKITRQFTQLDVDLLTKYLCSHDFLPSLNHEAIFQWRMKEDFSPYHIRQHLEKLGYTIEQPIWTFLSRMGQSKTLLPDETKVFIGGEYEDFYDPDFRVYNDIVIQKPDGEIQLWNYSLEQFPATDFHVAHYDKNSHSIFLIGNLGYPETRKEGITQVLKVNLKTMNIEQLACFGKMPSWLNHHEMKVINDDELEFKNGYLIKEKKYLRNLYTWRLSLRTLEWTFPEQTLFDHWTLKSVHLYGFPFHECHSLLWDEEYCENEKFEQTKLEITEHYGKLPNYQIYPQLFIPFENAQISHDDGEYRKHICSSHGFNFTFFEDDDLVEVIFPDVIPEDFQQKVIDDLKMKLEKISGHHVITEKVD